MLQPWYLHTPDILILHTLDILILYTPDILILYTPDILILYTPDILILYTPDSFTPLVFFTRSLMPKSDCNATPFTATHFH